MSLLLNSQIDRFFELWVLVDWLSVDREFLFDSIESLNILLPLLVV